LKTLPKGGALLVSPYLQETRHFSDRFDYRGVWRRKRIAWERPQQGQVMGTGGPGTGTGALGLGAKLCTDAVLVIDNQNVTLLPVGSTASSLMDKIPQIISSINQNKNSGTPAQ
jgi:hypothetical protein